MCKISVQNHINDSENHWIGCMKRLQNLEVGYVKLIKRHGHERIVPAHHKMFFNDDPESTVNDPLIVLGVNLSPFRSEMQFYICAMGLFSFTIVYGYLQELLSVTIMGRSYTLFLTMCQFAGYSFWSTLLFILNKYRNTQIMEKGTRTDCDEDSKSGETTVIRCIEEGEGHGPHERKTRDRNDIEDIITLSTAKKADEIENVESSRSTKNEISVKEHDWKDKEIPIQNGPSIGIYVLLSILRAIDIAFTNGSMRFLNYPAKTLMKSTKVAFTMGMGLIIGKKKYKMIDYVMVTMLVFGLSLFLHADHRSNAIFHPIGVIMLTLSLICDGAFNNLSESVMKKHQICQDRYQASVYSVSFLFVLIATIANGELVAGFQKMFLQHGTIPEIEENNIGLYHHHRENPTYTIDKKIIVLIFYTFTGLLGSSCAAAITKRFGALKTSITSTTRKAGTLFLSMVAPGFHNKCTIEHIMGVIIFVCALFVKSFKRGKKNDNSSTLSQKTIDQQETEILTLSTSSSTSSSEDVEIDWEHTKDSTSQRHTVVSP